MNQSLEAIYTYHQTTKHRYERFALGPAYMDWNNQPIPFRFYKNSKLHRFPFTTLQDFSYENLFHCSSDQSTPWDMQTLGFIFELSMGLSGWKAVDNTSWALRMNPSSGNLHPCEVYLFTDSIVDDDKIQLYHYTPFWHALESLGEVTSNSKLNLGNKSYLVLSSIFWREAWKYGERAFRYCQLDMGHSIAAISISAKMAGYDLIRDYSFTQKKAHKILGFENANRHPLEKEEAELGAWLVPKKTSELETPIDLQKEDWLNSISLKGDVMNKIPNLLSADHIEWQAIEQVINASQTLDSQQTASITGEENRII
ncbi:SagB/ThcOx family dehydrogenase, partial [bacterium]|nr:SagB/ThcOx family dehydrogenase [bacterium]